MFNLTTQRMAKVLLMSQEPNNVVTALVRNGGHDPTEAHSLVKGFEVAKTLPYGSIIVTEHNLSDGNAKDFMAMLDKEGLTHRVIVHSEDCNEKDVKKASKSRLYADFLYTAALDKTLLNSINDFLPGIRNTNILPGYLFQIKGEEADLLMYNICKMGPLEINVAISGETGLGKERVAKAIHEQSSRRDKPIIFVKHDKFFLHSDCHKTCEECYLHKCIREAENGTLVLVDLHLYCKRGQAIISSLLDDHKHNIRIIVTTNNDEMIQMVESGAFNRNLWLRLSHGLIELPPLRECPENIEWLSSLILSHFSETHNRPLVVLTEDALVVLKAFAWPGNVMQLYTVLNRASALTSKKKLKANDFLELVEKENEYENESDEQYVVRILSTSVTFEVAVRRYNKSRRTLQKRMVQYGRDRRGNRIHNPSEPDAQINY